ncbi:hypothetical protein GCM10010377_69330 [Streptomyces viridiviolaceus]|uniref:Uncharacterized protein n=1 Tax=Streptomyces viridiviolaceus TaxID=68282 RepID=A0ABW2EHB1_9ACTN|nr:hypothetical protein [Streptomyces viridiviolaceus]GHB68740.1 hypothetical protein GCM10010377_69330 [Streptomyces viridiviolaceus]
MTTTDTPTEPRRPWGRRGRHRRPRPRALLLAAGGLVLAAGALSLAHLTPEPGIGGGPDTEAGPRPAAGAETGRTVTAPVGAATAPEARPSATSVMGALSTPPTTGLIPAPSEGTTSAAPRPTTTTGSDAPDPSAAPGTDPTAAPDPKNPAPAPTSHPPGPQSPAPTPAPSRGTPPAAPPDPDRPGLCVPVVGLCVDLLDGPGD